MLSAAGMIGAALGPLPLGLAYGSLGGYDAAIAGMLVLPVIAVIAVLRAMPPSISSQSKRAEEPDSAQTSE